MAAAYTKMKVEFEGIEFYAAGGFLDVLEDFNKLLREKLGVSIGLSYLNGLPVAEWGVRFPSPPKPQKTQPSWRGVLGIRGKPSLEKVQHRFRILSLRHHPDRGGNRDRFEEILKAREAALAELGSRQ